jgi:hypothetical protein
MELHLVRAKAGDSAELRVTDTSGPVRIQATVGGRVVYEHECPDPPCHEYFRIDASLGGQVLQVVARSPDGAESQQSISIEGGQAMGQTF